MNRRLTLRREALADLTPHDLGAVGGAVPDAASLGGYCTTDLLKESVRVCSLRCPYTVQGCG